MGLPPPRRVKPPDLPPPPGTPSDLGDRGEGRQPIAMLDRPVGSDPAVLVVGAGQAMQDGIQAALQQRHIFSHAVSTDAAVECVRAAAPDLVLLVGDAAEEGGGALLEGLSRSPMTSVVPVAILADEAGLADRLRAFRHGATAVIPKSASVDEMAAEVEKLVREIPDRDGAALGNVGEATLRELVDTLSRELRTGILSVRGAGGSEDEAVRLVLGGGKPLAAAIDEFVRHLQSHVVHAEPLHYEFEEHAGGTLQLLGSESLTGEETEPSDISGVRIVLADDQSARADSVAQELRRAGAIVVVTDLTPNDLQFARLRQIDPTIVMVGEKTLHEGGYALLRRMRHDARLRWASLLIVRWEDLWSQDSPTPDLQATHGILADLSEPESSLRAQAVGENAFDVRLETMGPARLVRALASCPQTLRATVYNPRVAIQLDVAEGTVVSASGHTHADSAHHFEGTAALSALLVLSSGRVHIEREQHVGSPNVMSTVDVALNMADAVESPIAPSLPPPGTTISGAPPPVPDELTPQKKGSGLLLAVVALVLIGALGGGAYYYLRLAGAEKPVMAAQPSAAPAGGAASASEAPAASSAPPSSSAEAPTADAGVPQAAADAGSAQAAAEAPVPKGLVRETSVSTPTCEKLAGKLESLSGDEAAKESAVATRDARRALVLGDLERAQASLCRASKLRPKEPGLMSTLIRVVMMRRDGAQAVEHAKKASARFPEDATIHALLGDALARTGDVEGAKKAWLEAGRTKPDDVIASRRLARRFFRTASKAAEASEYSRAERFYRRVLFFERDDALAAEGIARTLLWQKDHAAAVSWAERALELSPRNASAMLIRADALAALDKRDDAEKAYIEVLKKAPGSKAARRGLARVRRRR